MTDDPLVEGGLPPSLKFLRALVIVLTLVMIGGVITVVGLLVTRMPDANALPLPENITLPDGSAAQAVTVTPEFLLIVTTGDDLLVYRRDGTFLRQMPLGE